eukprot:467108-Pelagomonas_calceolata.AAC.1
MTEQKIRAVASPCHLEHAGPCHPQQDSCAPQHGHTFRGRQHTSTPAGEDCIHSTQGLADVTSLAPLVS